MTSRRQRYPRAHAARRVAVVGGGNVAMDAARCALRLGAEEVSIVYRRSRGGNARPTGGNPSRQGRGRQLPHAHQPRRAFWGTRTARCSGMECVAMELGEPDASGSRRPVAKAGQRARAGRGYGDHRHRQFPQPPDSQHHPRPGNHPLGRHRGARRRPCETSRENVYAGGDAVTGAATVILAMGAGKAAARAIHEKLGKS